MAAVGALTRTSKLDVHRVIKLHQSTYNRISEMGGIFLFDVKFAS